MKKDVKRGRK